MGKLVYSLFTNLQKSKDFFKGKKIKIKYFVY